MIARPPRVEERAYFAAFYREQHTAFTAKPEAAAQLIHQGRAPVPSELDPAELAAWTTIANVLLNMDETVTRG